MALLAPRIMSTTTCLQLEESLGNPTAFDNYLSSEPHFSVSDTTRQHKTLTSQRLQSRQKVLLLKGVREQYTLVEDHTVPSILHAGEILVKVCSICMIMMHGSRSHILTLQSQVLAIGLNPIDWKAPCV